MLGVSKQVYYRSIKSTKKRKGISVEVIEMVTSVRNVMPKIGGRKLFHMLSNQLKEIGVGRDMLFRILRANHMLITPKKSKIRCSMTETYDPYVNAVVERINGILKQEFIGENRNIEIKIMKELVRDSVGIYNNIRPHYSCYMNTPKFMHQQNEIKIKTYKTKNTSKHVFAGM